MARQLVLDLAVRPALGRADFLVAPSNALAVAWVDRWPDWPMRRLAVTGPQGAGKTHLAHVWSARAGAAILPAEEAATLIAADRLWRTVIGLIRLTHGRSPEAALPAPAAAALLRAVAPLLEPRPVDLAGLRAQMQSMAGTVRAIFERRIGGLGGPIGEGQSPET